MAKKNATKNRNLRNSLRAAISSNSAAARLAVIAALVVCLGACVPEHASYSHFLQLPDEGWSRTTPLCFDPELSPDTAVSYDIELAIRHGVNYPYANLSVVVDLVDTAQRIERRKVTFNLADENGNWRGSGFGNIYQNKTAVAKRIKPAQMKRVIVWQNMAGVDTIKAVNEVGVFITPRE